MQTFWSLISERDQLKLEKYQRRRHNETLKPPCESPCKPDVTESDIKAMSLPAHDHRLREG